MEMAHNAAAEKSGATKYNHAQRHDAKLSHQLRLSILREPKARIVPGPRRRR